MAEINELQCEIGAWAVKNFPGDTRADLVLGLVEEVGELARAVLKQNQGVRGNYTMWENAILDELPDVFIKLCHVCAVFGYDLETLVQTKWATVQNRTSGSEEEQKRV
jgi:NTP pyrophosphatase (non-canonical NTP hydrolase)